MAGRHINLPNGRMVKVGVRTFSVKGVNGLIKILKKTKPSANNVFRVSFPKKKVISLSDSAARRARTMVEDVRAISAEGAKNIRAAGRMSVIKKSRGDQFPPLRRWVMAAIGSALIGGLAAWEYKKAVERYKKEKQKAALLPNGSMMKVAVNAAQLRKALAALRAKGAVGYWPVGKEEIPAFWSSFAGKRGTLTGATSIATGRMFLPWRERFLTTPTGLITAAHEGIEQRYIRKIPKFIRGPYWQEVMNERVRGAGTPLLRSFEEVGKGWKAVLKQPSLIKKLKAFKDKKMFKKLLKHIPLKEKELGLVQPLKRVTTLPGSPAVGAWSSHMSPNVLLREHNIHATAEGAGLQEASKKILDIRKGTKASPRGLSEAEMINRAMSKITGRPFELGVSPRFSRHAIRRLEPKLVETLRSQNIKRYGNFSNPAMRTAILPNGSMVKVGAEEEKERGVSRNAILLGALAGLGVLGAGLYGAHRLGLFGGGGGGQPGIPANEVDPSAVAPSIEDLMQAAPYEDFPVSINPWHQWVA